ncbi:MAG: DUF1624 domain-containing protein [Aquabacterium sp.]|jgi:uncharacterized membrane protein|nr:MAG: DUF1624 domain-containing protein [Aquabacterium sp.]
MAKTAAPPDPTAASSRYDRLDALRGFALVWMAGFHFCFDLFIHRLLDTRFYTDPLWIVQRTCILSLFLLCAGAGQAVATHQGQSWRRFWRRWAQIVGCAALVSAGSWWMFGPRFIYFGVLHAMALMLIVARLSAPLGRWLFPLGALALLLPQFVQHPVFDSPWLNWTGLVTRKPQTEDYVPLLPWLGVMWWGLAATRELLKRPALLAGSLPPGGRALAGLGRWSLSFYMLHQPVLIGLLQAWLYWRLRA